MTRVRFASVAAATPLELRVENVRVHETADPEVVVAEFDHRGRSLSTGRSFSAADIQVLRARDGVVVATRDFHDHVAVAMATGAVPALDEAARRPRPGPGGR